MPDRLRSLPWWARLSAAAVLGVLAAFGFAPSSWWPLLLPAVAGLSLLCLSAHRHAAAFGTGLFFGLGFLAVGIPWMSVIFVEAMLGLVAMEALFFGGLGVLLRLAAGSRWWPLLAAGAWLLTEFAFSRVPFDGFPWMRLGYAVVDAPFAGWLPLLGVPGVSFLVALCGQLLAAVVLAGGRRQRALAALGAALVLVSGLVGSLYRPAATGRPVNVGYVQGNAPGGGIYGLGEPRSITRNHLAETRRLVTRVAAGDLPRPEVVIWPENGTDMDPLRDAPTGLLVRAAVADAGVPLMLGTISDGPGPRQRQTTSLVWDPVTGPGATYHKRNLVPFGEWVPYREVLEPLFPVVAYVGAQSVPGTGPGVLAVPSARGGLRLGTMICYEVAFDETVHQTVTGGAELLVVQSSNAMYVGTGQVHQQFAITRARAAELRRDILVVTVTGISGLIRADGSTAFTLPEHQPASGVVTLQISDVITPAAAIGGWLEPAGALLAAAGLALSVVARRRTTAPLAATYGVAEA